MPRVIRFDLWRSLYRLGDHVGDLERRRRRRQHRGTRRHQSRHDQGPRLFVSFAAIAGPGPDGKQDAAFRDAYPYIAHSPKRRARFPGVPGGRSGLLPPPMATSNRTSLPRRRRSPKGRARRPSISARWVRARRRKNARCLIATCSSTGEVGVQITTDRPGTNGRPISVCRPTPIPIWMMRKSPAW